MAAALTEVIFVLLFAATASSSLWTTTEGNTRSFVSGPTDAVPRTIFDNSTSESRAVNNTANTFIVTTINKTATTGNTVFLPCETPSYIEESPQVSWVRRNDWHILTSGLQAYTKEQRFAVHHTKDSSKWTLAIKYIKMSDAGMYECQVVGGTTSISHLVQLTVVTPQAVIPGTGEHHVDAGSTISLECFIQKSSTAPQFIFWYHNTRMINYDRTRGGITVTIDTEPQVRSRLSVTNAKATDSGNYTCAAANTEPASITVYIAQVNKIAAIQSRAVGSSSRMAVVTSSLLWLPIAIALARLTRPNSPQALLRAVTLQQLHAP